MKRVRPTPVVLYIMHCYSILWSVLCYMSSSYQMKEQAVVHHQPLVLQLLKPAFCPANECLSAKKDFSLSVCLLACMKVAGYLDIKSDSRIAQDAQLFRIAATEELKTMGIHDPFASLRDKGRVGNDTLDWVIERFRQSTSSRCAVSSSIVGAIAAQELIKSVTHLYLPISQFLMIESLDAVSSSWNATCEQKGKDDASSRRDDYASIYGSAVMDELSSLKVFVVGSGAIGCELLKNFALLGIGQASAGDPSCDTSSSPVDSEPSLWTSYGLQHGGVLVTDMDSIERSNLNRQLLFRERHVGGSKSLIAAQQVQLINPAMRVQGITNKLGPETGVVHPYVLYVCEYIHGIGLVDCISIYCILLREYFQLVLLEASGHRRHCIGEFNCLPSDDL